MSTRRLAREEGQAGVAEDLSRQRDHFWLGLAFGLGSCFHALASIRLRRKIGVIAVSWLLSSE